LRKRPRWGGGGGVWGGGGGGGRDLQTSPKIIGVGSNPRPKPIVNFVVIVTCHKYGGGGESARGGGISGGGRQEKFVIEKLTVGPRKENSVLDEKRKPASFQVQDMNALAAVSSMS